MGTNKKYKTKTTKKKKTIEKKKHRHVWINDYDGCPNCGYFEKCCKNCTVCVDGRTGEIVSE